MTEGLGEVAPQTETGQTPPVEKSPIVTSGDVRRAAEAGALAPSGLTTERGMAGMMHGEEPENLTPGQKKLVRDLTAPGAVAARENLAAKTSASQGTQADQSEGPSGEVPSTG